MRTFNPVGRRAVVLGLGCVPVAALAEQSFVVVASFSILADMVRRVSGDLVHVVSLVPHDSDSHVYQPTAADSRSLSTAGVIVENGLALEGWMARLGEAARFRGIRIIATAGIKPRNLDGHSDPHAWQDPRLSVTYVRNIAAGLAAADQDHAENYRVNAAAYISEIESLDAWIVSRFASIPVAARRIITTHDAFGYYGDRYAIKFLSAQGIATDSEPSAKGIMTLITQIRREKARTVFLENMTDPRLARMLASETGATVSGPLYSDALSGPDGPAPDYLTMLRYNTTWFERAMRAV